MPEHSGLKYDNNYEYGNKLNFRFFNCVCSEIIHAKSVRFCQASVHDQRHCKYQFFPPIEHSCRQPPAALSTQSQHFPCTTFCTDSTGSFDILDTLISGRSFIFYNFTWMPISMFASLIKYFEFSFMNKSYINPAFESVYYCSKVINFTIFDSLTLQYVLLII